MSGTPPPAPPVVVLLLSDINEAAGQSRRLVGHNGKVRHYLNRDTDILQSNRFLNFYPIIRSIDKFGYIVIR
jgi:hypothetical protein